MAEGTYLSLVPFAVFANKQLWKGLSANAACQQLRRPCRREQGGTEDASRCAHGKTKAALACIILHCRIAIGHCNATRACYVYVRNVIADWLEQGDCDASVASKWFVPMRYVLRWSMR